MLSSRPPFYSSNDRHCAPAADRLVSQDLGTLADGRLLDGLLVGEHDGCADCGCFATERVFGRLQSVAIVTVAPGRPNCRH